ncbi:MAG: beta-ketoacyl synthase N-terminal-like domain-containing protein [Minwuia sp.]|nr:beta-ketoacyl synthase N-terminal-like domain-containing protein [Minwuia sp.]
MEPIAITGTGIVSSLGSSVQRFHQNVMAGRTGIGVAPWYDPDRDPRRIFWGLVTDFNPDDWMSPKVAEGSDMFAQFALAAARQAMMQAGLDSPAPDNSAIDPERTGVVHGTSGGGVRAFQKAQYMLDTHGPEAVPMTLAACSPTPPQRRRATRRKSMRSTWCMARRRDGRHPCPSRA